MTVNQQGRRDGLFWVYSYLQGEFAENQYHSTDTDVVLLKVKGKYISTVTVRPKAGDVKYCRLFPLMLN